MRSPEPADAVPALWLEAPPTVGTDVAPNVVFEPLLLTLLADFAANSFCYSSYYFDIEVLFEERDRESAPCYANAITLQAPTSQPISPLFWATPTLRAVGPYRRLELAGRPIVVIVVRVSVSLYCT